MYLPLDLHVRAKLPVVERQRRTGLVLDWASGATITRREDRRPRKTLSTQSREPMQRTLAGGISSREARNVGGKDFYLDSGPRVTAIN